MRVTKSQLRRIIREEKERLIRESRSRRSRSFRMTESQLRGLVRHAILNEEGVWDTIKTGAQQLVDLPGRAVKATGHAVKRAGDVVTQGVEDAGDYYSEKAEEVVPLRMGHKAGQYVKDVVADPRSLERATYRGSQAVKDVVAKGKEIAEPIAQDWWDLGIGRDDFGLFEDDVYEDDEMEEGVIDTVKGWLGTTDISSAGHDRLTRATQDTTDKTSAVDQPTNIEHKWKGGASGTGAFPRP